MAGDASSSIAPAPATGAQRLAPILPAFGVALAAFAWLGQVNPQFLTNDDSIRDQLLVRDCTDLGRCHLIGAPTSLSGFYQGAVWLDLLTAVRLLGGDGSSERAVVLVFLALSAATLFVVTWRWLRVSIALPGAVLLIGALGVDAYVRLLVNSSVAAFPDVLTAAGLLCYALSGQRRFLILAACVLGAGINVHLGSLSLVAPLLAIAVLGRPRSWRELFAAVAVLGATYFLTSSAALRANFIALAQQGRLVPALAGGLVLVLLSALLGSRFRRLSWDARAWITGFILLLPFGLASSWLVFWQKHHFAIFYLHPILGPAAALGAAILSLPFELGARRWGALRWIPTAASAAAIAFVALGVWQPAASTTPSVGNSWSLAESAAIADRATRRGWSHEDLLYRVQGTACRELLAGMSVTAPPPSGNPNRGPRQLQVVKLTRDALPAFVEPDDVVPLGPTTVAVLREIESWLRPGSLRACRVPVASGSPALCSDATPRATGTLAPERFLFITRSFLEVHDLDLPPPYIATYEIPLAPGAGESRDLALTDHGAGDGSWRIARTEGVRVEGRLPARRVRLRSDTGSPGRLVFERPFGTRASSPGDIDMRYPPCVFEAPPGDALQALVGAR